MPKPYPREFRDDVVRVARDREPGVTVQQIAKDFGVHPMTSFKWLRQADVNAGAAPGTAGSESVELREAPGLGCWSRRTRSCGGPRRSGGFSSPTRQRGSHSCMLDLLRATAASSAALRPRDGTARRPGYPRRSRTPRAPDPGTG
ncbi:transposase, partial [Micromonospora sp. NPDC002411]